MKSPILKVRLQCLHLTIIDTSVSIHHLGRRFLLLIVHLPLFFLFAESNIHPDVVVTVNFPNGQSKVMKLKIGETVQVCHLFFFKKQT